MSVIPVRLHLSTYGQINNQLCHLKWIFILPLPCRRSALTTTRNTFPSLAFYNSASFSPPKWEDGWNKETDEGGGWRWCDKSIKVPAAKSTLGADGHDDGIIMLDRVNWHDCQASVSHNWDLMILCLQNASHQLMTSLLKLVLNSLESLLQCLRQIIV